MNMGKVIAGISVAIAATLFFSIFIVKEVNQAIVLQFGDPKRIIAWLTSLTIITDRKATTPIATNTPANIFPAFILIRRFLF